MKRVFLFYMKIITNDINDKKCPTLRSYYIDLNCKSSYLFICRNFHLIRGRSQILGLFKFDINVYWVVKRFFLYFLLAYLASVVSSLI